MKVHRSRPFPGLIRKHITTDDGSEDLTTVYERAPSPERGTVVPVGRSTLLLLAAFCLGLLLGGLPY